MSGQVAVAFASCTEDLIRPLVERVRSLCPGVPVYVVSEFPIDGVHWIPYEVNRSFLANLARLRSLFRGEQVLYAGLVLQPNLPYWGMRMVPLWLWPFRVIAYNENLDHFMLRPRCAGTIVRHCWWRLGNLVRWRASQGRSF